MMQFFKMGWSGRELRDEFIAAGFFPNYDDRPDWFVGKCREQGKTVGEWEGATEVHFREQHPVVITINDLSKLPKTRQAIGFWYDASKFSHIQLFIVPPKMMGSWHLDGVDRHSAINIPCFNCEKNSYIEWTDASNIKNIHTYRSKFTTHVGSYDTDVPVTDRLTLDEIALLRVDTWHRPNNEQSDKHRVSLSIRYNDNPTFDEMYPRVINKTKAAVAGE